MVYCQGCPWRCGYCHNPHLLEHHAAAGMGWAEVLEFLGRRRGLIDAVVFSGGEPTAQPGLVRAMREVKGLGYRIGMHSAGVYPRRFAEALSLLDWVGFDAKAPFDAAYARITGVHGSAEAARTSAQALLASGVAYEFRTTWNPHILTPGELERLATMLAELGVRRYVLQECRDGGRVASANAEWATQTTLDFLARRFAQFSVRRA